MGGRLRERLSSGLGSLVRSVSSVMLRGRGGSTRRSMAGADGGAEGDAGSGLEGEGRAEAELGGLPSRP